MSEDISMEKFNRFIDLIVKKDGVVFEMAGAEDRDLLQLARNIKEIDYSGESLIGNILKERLLEKIKGGGELADEELDYAAGGLFEFRDKDNPPKS